ncbi:hypothetical protein LINGRAHAP2_LOCUS26080 [Linum grandiflorum]
MCPRRGLLEFSTSFFICVWRRKPRGRM